MVSAYQHSSCVACLALILASEGQWLFRCFHPTLGTVSSIGRALTSVRRLRVRFPYCPVEIQGSSSSHCLVLEIASCVNVAWSICWAHWSSVFLWLYEYQIALESHAAIQLYFVIDIVLLAMSLQAHLYGVFVHPRTCSFSLLQETSSVDRAASLLS